MILSFSVDEMKPYVIDGIQQAKGLNIRTRVKRQTIRKWGPQAERVWNLMGQTGKFPYSLSLWWKSRTKEREFLGVFEKDCVSAAPISLENLSMPDGSSWVRINFADSASHFVADFSYADGFDSPEAFRDYFVPNAGDVFKGILYRW